MRDGQRRGAAGLQAAPRTMQQRCPAKAALRQLPGRGARATCIPPAAHLAPQFTTTLPCLPHLPVRIVGEAQHLQCRAIVQQLLGDGVLDPLVQRHDQGVVVGVEHRVGIRQRPHCRMTGGHCPLRQHSSSN